MKYITIKQLLELEEYPFSRGQLRNFLLQRNENGLASAIRKIGKRLYIRKDLFDLWLESFTDR